MKHGQNTEKMEGIAVARVFGMVTTRASAAYTLPALQSFFDHTPWQPGDAFLLIDNDAGFDNNLLVSSCAPVQLIVNPQPLSFAANANQVLRHAAQSNADAVFVNNDVIFTADWLTPVLSDAPAVVTPTSNQNYQYELDGLALKPVMTFEDYFGKESQLGMVVAQHRARHQGYVEAYKTNFFCVRIPPQVYLVVGLFDTSFGMAGGEDDDYCIRAYLHGFRVLVAVESYLLHFGGRSTWSGNETLEQWRAREKNFIGIFQKKWGPTLSRFLLYRDASILSSDPLLQLAQQRGGIAGLFTEMARRDGISIEEALKPDEPPSVGSRVT
jgi:GT2 family glycosyltransferase